MDPGPGLRRFNAANGDAAPGDSRLLPAAAESAASLPALPGEHSRTDRCAEDVYGAAGFGDVGRRLHRAMVHPDVRGILWARLRHGLAGDLARDAGGGPRVLLRHGQYPHQCGRGPGSVQSALQDGHERPHLPGQSQPPAAGPSGGQLLRCRHLAAESAHRAQHELFRESRDEVPPPRQPIRRHPPGPRACELLGADVAPFQHQRHGRVPLSRRAGHGHGSSAAQQPPLLPGDHAGLGAFCSALDLHGLCLGFLVSLLSGIGQPALQQ